MRNRCQFLLSFERIHKQQKGSKCARERRMKLKWKRMMWFTTITFLPRCWFEEGEKMRSWKLNEQLYHSLSDNQQTKKLIHKTRRSHIRSFFSSLKFSLLMLLWYANEYICSHYYYHGLKYNLGLTEWDNLYEKLLLSNLYNLFQSSLFSFI